MIKKTKLTVILMTVICSVFLNGCITLPLSQKVNDDIDNAYAAQMVVMCLSLHYRHIYSHWPKTIKDLKVSQFLISNTKFDDKDVSVSMTFPSENGTEIYYLHDLNIPFRDYSFSWDKDSNLIITYRKKVIDAKDFLFSEDKNSNLKIIYQNTEIGIYVELETDPKGNLIGLGGRDPRGILK